MTQKQKWLYKIILFIAWITILSGLGQVLAAPFILNLVGADQDKTSAHFFAIIGMFMFLFGGLLVQVLTSRRKDPTPVFWCALQKLGAALAVGLGVYHAVFSAIVLGIAAFDLLSGVLLIIYWRNLDHYNNW
ncbi:patatin [Adhaeribacter radiodurans]|uniref:Patatin n=1 Tax=Adhaeribacter radiodurans TaxID=2745197 RepID=A0A7L7LGG8_9BACT|nr:patatin [Adhaeribacter radiodurans]